VCGRSFTYVSYALCLLCLICVLILLYMCPHSALPRGAGAECPCLIYVSSYCYTCVRIVHCRAGLGRTGTLIALWMMRGTWRAREVLSLLALLSLLCLIALWMMRGPRARAWFSVCLLYSLCFAPTCFASTKKFDTNVQILTPEVRARLSRGCAS
jgi:hypothetical protein